MDRNWRTVTQLILVAGIMLWYTAALSASPLPHDAQTDSPRHDLQKGKWRPVGHLSAGGGDNVVRVKAFQPVGTGEGDLNLVYAMPGIEVVKKKRHIRTGVGSGASEELTDLVLGQVPAAGDPGKPVLPVVPCTIVLPAGMTCEDVQVTPGKKVKIPGTHRVRHGQKAMLPGAKMEYVPPDPKVYGSDDPWPRKRYEIIGVHKKRGVSILILNLNPVVYYPKSGKLSRYESMAVKIITRPDTAASGIRYRTDPIRPAAKGMDNPTTLATYEAVPGVPVTSGTETSASLVPYQTLSVEGGGSTTGLCDPGQTFRYVIVTSLKISQATTSPNINDFIAQKQAYGLSTTVVTMERILAQYPGVDSPEKLRNFIKDAYNTWGTDFVLLAGDCNIIPRRLVSAEGEVYPSDIYYQCLDGTYNSDNDSRWGESSDGPDGIDVDLVADVYVGRASVEDPIEFSNFIYKTLAHENSSDDESHLRNALLTAEAIYYDGSETLRSMEDVRLGGSTSGYTTAGFAACPEISVDRLYDYPAGWEGNPTRYIWPVEEILTRLNSNTFGIICHLGHSNADYNMRIYNPDVDNLTNDKYFFLYGAGCLAGRFDADCIAEHWTTSTRHGAFATVHNSIEVWSGNLWGELEGPTERMMRQFWNGYFGKHHFHLGAMHADSREDNLWCIGRPGMRLTLYASNLFGDPHVALRGQQAISPLLSLASFSPGDFVPGGNGDGIVNPGESISVVVALKNPRLNSAAGVAATLSTTDPYVTVTDDSSAFGSVPGLGEKSGLDPFVISVSPSCPTPHEVVFDLNIVASDSGPWSNSFTLSVLASTQVWGQVTGASGGTGIADAKVVYWGPVSGTVTTASDGSYLFGGPDGVYTLVAKASGYFDSAPVEVTLPPGHTDVDFSLSRATIEVSPGFVSGSAMEGSVSSNIVAVTNQGDATLTWKIVSQFTKGDVVDQCDVPESALDSWGYVTSLMAYDGRFLWFPCGDYFDAENRDKLYKIDPTNGAEVGSIRIPDEGIVRLCWYGGKLWALSYSSLLSSNRIIVVDSASGAILKAIPFSGSRSSVRSISVDAEAIWVLTDTRTVKKLSVDDGAELESFSLPSQIVDPSAITSFNGNLWVTTALRDYGMAYKVNPSNGSLLDSVPVPGSQLGGSSCEILSVAHDSLQHLWFLIRSRGGSVYPGISQKVLVMNTGELTWLKATPTSGSIPPGGSQSVTVTMDADTLKAGIHAGNIVFDSNDTAALSRIMPVTFTVHVDSDGDGISDADDPDDDNDGMSDEDEGIAGTNPLDADSVFSVQCSVFSGDVFQLLLNSVTGRLYSVFYKDDLMVPGWNVLTNGLPGDGTVMSVVDPEDAEQRYYRITVRVEQ